MFEIGDVGLVRQEGDRFQFEMRDGETHGPLLLMVVTVQCVPSPTPCHAPRRSATPKPRRVATLSAARPSSIAISRTEDAAPAWSAGQMPTSRVQRAPSAPIENTQNTKRAD